MIFFCICKNYEKNDYRSSNFRFWNGLRGDLSRSNVDPHPHSHPHPGVETTWLYMECPFRTRRDGDVRISLFRCLRHLSFASIPLCTGFARHFNVWNGVPCEDRNVFIRIIFRGPVSQVFETS